jgi:hypothetical protein
MAIYSRNSPALPLSPREYDQMQQEQFQNALRLYFTYLDRFLPSVATPEYGITADRPTQYLQIGQFYFDTTLGYPVWWDGEYWVDALGQHPVSVPVIGVTSTTNIGTVLVTT